YSAQVIIRLWQSGRGHCNTIGVVDIQRPDRLNLVAMKAQSNTVDGILRRTAARTPATIALRFQNREWSYHGLEVAVTAAAGWLCSHNLSRGAHVAAYGVNSDAYLIGFLACARAGLVHVPINYALSGNELS